MVYYNTLFQNELKNQGDQIAPSPLPDSDNAPASWWLHGLLAAPRAVIV